MKKNAANEIEKRTVVLIRELSDLLDDRYLNAKQYNTVAQVYHGLLFWQRTDLALMMKEFTNGKS